MDYQEIISGTVGAQNTYGTVVGKLAATPLTYCRVSTTTCVAPSAPTWARRK